MIKQIKIVSDENLKCLYEIYSYFLTKSTFLSEQRIGFHGCVLFVSEKPGFQTPYGSTIDNGMVSNFCRYSDFHTDNYAIRAQRFLSPRIIARFVRLLLPGDVAKEVGISPFRDLFVAQPT